MEVSDRRCDERTRGARVDHLQPSSHPRIPHTPSPLNISRLSVTAGARRYCYRVRQPDWSSHQDRGTVCRLFRSLFGGQEDCYVCACAGACVADQANSTRVLDGQTPRPVIVAAHLPWLCVHTNCYAVC